MEVIVNDRAEIPEESGSRRERALHLDAQRKKEYSKSDIWGNNNMPGKRGCCKGRGCGGP